MNRKLKVVVLNSLKTLLTPLFGIVVSLITITNASIEVWGGFVSYQIVIGLSGAVLSFGSQEYLLRKFSKDPTNIRNSWQSNIISRTPLLVLGMLLMPLIFFQSEKEVLFHILVWLIFNFINKSFDPLILYKKLFTQTIIVEVILLLGSVLYLFHIETINVYQLCVLYSVVSVLRFLLLLTFLFADTFRFLHFTWEPENLKGSVAFIISNLTSLLNSRIDLYIISLTLTDAQVGTYQVITSFLVHFQSVAGFALSPFIKNIYRTTIKVNYKLSKKLFLAGLMGTLVFIPILYAVLTNLYSIDVEWVVYLIIIPYVTPIFFSLPIIYLLYKNDMERVVTKVSVVKLIFNSILILSLIPVYGILGSLLACAVSNTLVGSYYGLLRHRLNKAG